MEAGPRETDGTTGDIPRQHRGARVPARDAEPAMPPPPETAEENGPEENGDRAESYGELRPPRRLRALQIIPIVLLGLLGSLMFAFPLAFTFDDGGAVVAMTGLLIGCSAAGLGMMAALRVGYTLPGLPARGSGRRPDWRLITLYGLGFALLAALAVSRVALLR